MTKHNLQQNLRWLIQISYSFPNSYPTPPPVNSSSPHATESDNVLAQYSDSQAGVETRPENATFPIAHPEFLRPSLPASAVKGQSKNDMARLQASGKSTNRTRLLSEGNTATVKPSPSLRETYTAHYHNSKDGAGEKDGFSDFPAQTIDNRTASIDQDYTEERSGRASSSSTVEIFGEPKALWTEASAFRKSPLGDNARKRKSDQLGDDEIWTPDQTSNGPCRISQGSFVAIDNFSDGGTPSATVKLKAPGYSRKSIKRDDAKDGIPDDQQVKGEASGSASQSHKGLGSSPNRVLTQVWNPKEPTLPPFSKPTSVKMEQISYTSTASIEQDGIADSEESAEEIFHPSPKLPIQPKRESPPFASRLTASPSRHKLQLPSPQQSACKRETSTQRPLKPIETGSDEKDQGFSASPFQKDSPTKVFQAGRRSPRTKSSAQSLNILMPLDRDALQSFLDYEPGQFSKHLDDLYRDRRVASDAIYKLNIAGEHIRSELRDQPALLTTKIQAMEELRELRKDYNKSTERKEKCKTQIIGMIEQDYPQQSYVGKLSYLHLLLENLEQQGKRMCSLLSGLELPSGDNSTIEDEHSIIEPRVAQDIERSKLLVESTPATHRKSSPPAYGDRPIEPVNVLPRNFVQQTQAGSLEASVAERREPATSSWKQPQSPSRSSGDVRSVQPNVHFSPSKQPGQKQLARRDTLVRTPDKLEDRPMNQSSPSRNHAKGPNVFSYNMRSPQHERSWPDDTEYMEEDYGHEDDDVDMLEAMDELEKQPPPAFDQQTRPLRDALTETSGNAVRAAAPRNPAASGPVAPHASQMQHPWSKDVKAAMKDRFHLKGFRQNQLEAINATLAGKDAFVLMPTGGGKSLCYQLPSIVTSGKTRGVTVVISPLLSLMHDQVEHLQKLKIQALLINGEVNAQHRKLVMSCLQESHPQKFCSLLYITPEMINNSGAMQTALRDLHRRRQLARLVIDEAHCVSQWGHDFRPDYKQLGEIRRQFRGVPLIALTATATENVKVDVIHNLSMSNCEIFTQSFNRPNLSYEVRTKGKAKEVVENIAQTINGSYRGQTGIIYCLSKKNCEDLAAKLRNDHGIRAHHYHAGMEPEQKKEVQKAWQSGKHHVIVATIAFGMGIDKPDVRYVIHHTIPKSLEGYYQETGRAGRDGRKSGCILYYGYGDSSALKRMIDDGDGSVEQKDRQRQMLRKVVQFCENRSDCRRVQILGYFNETFGKEQCGASCDNCSSTTSFVTEDLTEYASLALELVEQVQDDNVTILHCVDILRGSRPKKIVELGHDQLPQFGEGSQLDRGHVERLLYRLLGEDAIMEINKMNRSGFANQYVRLGAKAEDFRSGQRRLRLQVRQSPTGKSIPKRKPKKGKTGVAAAALDYPLSTNVSSPIQPQSLRKGRQPNRIAKPDDDEFTAADRTDDDDGAYGTDSSSGFESVQRGGTAMAAKRRAIGPPITADDTLDNLEPVHRMVVDDFVNIAKHKNEEIFRKKNLRDRPFSESSLRAMAINFTKSEADMMKIPGIEREKVSHYARHFIPLVRQAHLSYDGMMRRADQPADPNHVNVIDISSDSDDAHAQLADDDLSSTGGEQSTYFADPEVESFNEQYQNLQSQTAAGASTKSQRSTGKAPKRGRGGYKAYGKQGSSNGTKPKYSSRGKSSSRGGGAAAQQSMRRFTAMPT